MSEPVAAKPSNLELCDEVIGQVLASLKAKTAGGTGFAELGASGGDTCEAERMVFSLAKLTQVRDSLCRPLA